MNKQLKAIEDMMDIQDSKKMKRSNHVKNMQELREKEANNKRLKFFLEGLPARYAKAQRSDFDNSVQGKINKWSENDSWVMLIQGFENGTGKTHLAYAIMRYMAFLDPKRSIIYHSSSNEFFRWLQKDYDRDSLTDNAGLAKKCDLLLIDDLGKEKTSADVRGLMIEILHDRYYGNKKTIITTNNKMDDIEKKFDNSVKSRLLEGSFVIMKGEDRRLKK